MEQPTASVSQLTVTARHFIQRLLTVGENRLELLVVEVQDERSRLIHALLLAFGVIALGLLAGMTLTATIVIVLWAYSPVLVLLSLTGLYVVLGLLLGHRLTVMQRNWRPLSASLDQLRKDRACLENILAWTRSNPGNAC